MKLTLAVPALLVLAITLVLAGCAQEPPTPEGPPRDVSVDQALRAADGDYLRVSGWYMKDGATNVLCSQALTRNETTTVPFCDGEILGISDQDPELIDDIRHNPVSMAYWTEDAVRFSGTYEGGRLTYAAYEGPAE